MDFTNSLIGPDQADAATAATPETNTGELPVDQIAELPPVRAVLEGKPAAIYADETVNSPLAHTIGKNFKKVGELGLALYRSPNKVVVMFNPAVLDPSDLRAADRAGKLDDVAVSMASFESTGAPKTPESAPGAPEPVSGAPAPVSEGLTPRAQSKLAGKRITALMDDEAPSKRPVPGAGKILNGLLERAV